MKRRVMLFLATLCVVIFINFPVYTAESSHSEPPLVRQFTHGIGGS